MNIAIKTSYLLVAGTIALASCSQDEKFPGYNDADRQVVFRTALPELTSRAQEVTQSNLKHFYVTAFDMDEPSTVVGAVKRPLFAFEKVDIKPGKNAYTSPNCSWPEAGKESNVVTFFGFYPGLPEVEGAHLVNSSTASTIDYRMTGFRVARDIADQLDFITAYTTGTMADNLVSGILLPYSHQLSRIEIKAYGAHKSCDIEIAGVRIGGTGVEGTFQFKPIDGGGEWAGAALRDSVEYVFRKGDYVITNGKNHRVDASAAVSIMGSKRSDGKDNCAMLIPGNYQPWDHANDRRNNGNKMYISVLMRVTDTTTSGAELANKQLYPYTTLSQGADALNIPVVYMAINEATGAVGGRLYKKGDSYYTDENCQDPYEAQAGEEIKQFGWAAVPVKGEWAPGYVYTYTLDYTYGVGLHEPVVTTASPGAGDPIISDKVGISYDVEKWRDGGGDSFIVPGS